MKRKEYLNLKHEDKFLLMIKNIEKKLMLSFIFLLPLLLISQVLLYNNLGNEFLNPVYQMEGDLFTNEGSESIYTLLCIYGEIPEFESIWILKNGIRLGELVKGAPVYVYVFDGDVIEIDATYASGTSYEILIENISSGQISKDFPHKIVLRDKFYRLPPFY